MNINCVHQSHTTSVYGNMYPSQVLPLPALGNVPLVTHSFGLVILPLPWKKALVCFIVLNSNYVNCTGLECWTVKYYKYREI